MAFDQPLADRIRKSLQSVPGVIEQKMMGGLCFMAGGHMACGIHETFLIVRVGADAYGSVLNERHVQPMQIGRMKPGGFVFVEPAGYATDAALQGWITRGLNFAATLPPRKPSHSAKTDTATQAKTPAAKPSKAQAQASKTKAARSR